MNIKPFANESSSEIMASVSSVVAELKPYITVVLWLGLLIWLLFWVTASSAAGPVTLTSTLG